MSSLEELQQKLGCVFSNLDLLESALTHPSYTLENPECLHYERLEFLGDSVLALVITQALYQLYPQEREGGLAKYRAALVCAEMLVKVAQELGLSQFIRLSKAESVAGGSVKASILENVFEAVIGAIFLEHGLEGAREFIVKSYGDLATRLSKRLDRDNPKGTLQEYLQQHGKQPTYILEKAMGPDHERKFYVNLFLDSHKIGTGAGSSIKIAEKEAAFEGLVFLQNNPEAAKWLHVEQGGHNAS